MSRPVLVPDIFDSKQLVVGFSLHDPQNPAATNYSRMYEHGPRNQDALLAQQTHADTTLITACQDHTDLVYVVEDQDLEVPTCDALVTKLPNVCLGVLVADCAAILLHDPKAGVIAVVHSGWRGSAQNIISTTVSAMTGLGANPADCLVWISPMAQATTYIVRNDVASQFNNDYTTPAQEPGEFYFDNKAVIADQLLRCGVPSSSIASSERNTMTEATLHSARRDGAQSGRMLAFIGLL